MNLRTAGLSLCVGLALSCGCGGRSNPWKDGRPQTVDVAGTLTYHGDPVSEATVTFLPVNGSHTAFARTDGKGRFELTTFEDEDGAVPGEYKVTVSKFVIEYEPNPNDPERLPPLYHAEQSQVPVEYADRETTLLLVTVPENGEDGLALELTGELSPKRVLADRRSKPQNEIF